MLLGRHRLVRQFPAFYSVTKRHINTNATRLNILFCGADAFSIHSLDALHKLSAATSSSPITSLTVLCRPDKYTGRGYQTLSSPPIKAFAQDRNLPILQIDTFTGWTPLTPIDLVVTVSFGLLVPGRILSGARWGGVNVHPSLLPDLRGPAPIQRALLEGRRETGVSLQTMHPERFDAGEVLNRTKVAVPLDAGVEDMINLLGPMGADMLQNWIAAKAYANEDVFERSLEGEMMASTYAAKVTKEDRRVDWRSWDAEKVMRYDRVLGDLWDMTTYRECHPAKIEDRPPKRVTFHGPWKRVDGKGQTTEILCFPTSRAALCRLPGVKGLQFAMETADGELVAPSSATIEGGKKGKALPGLVRGLEKQ